MERYYRKYYILNSYNDRCKSMTIKAMDNNDGYVNITVTFNGKEIRQNLFLLGFSNKGYVIFKKKISSSMTIDKNNFDRILYLAVILEKENACSLEYLQMEHQTHIQSSFESYRFDSFSKNKSQKHIGKKEPVKKQAEKEALNNDTKSRSTSSDKQSNNNNQTQNLSDMMKTFSKASSMLDSFNSMSNNQNTQNEKEVKSPSKETINPFTGTFPNSEWVKTEFHGNSGYWHYLSGKIFENENLLCKAIAVPGEYSTTPPAWLDGFSKFYVCDTPYANGYWITFTDPKSGNVISAPNV